MKPRTFSLYVTMIAVLAMAIACKQTKEDTKGQETEIEIDPSETVREKITLEKLQYSPVYADAALVLENPSGDEIASTGETDFNFNVENYELGAQTDGPNAELLANSGQGQHIHFILNNEPYSAHYESTFSKEIPSGVHHLVAFLSRSYHESVKNENSVVVRKLKVGENVTDTRGLDMDAPTLIYSRPKGEYSGKDTENLLLDFFVINTTLSEDGHKVRVTVNDDQFMITEWAPHILKGLPMGEVTIQLELLDAGGNPVPGPFNNVTRVVNLKE